MKPSWILLAVFVQVLSSVASVIPQVLVNSDTDHVNAVVFTQDRKASKKTLIDVLKENKLLDMADLIYRAGLTKNFTSTDNFTVLAPSDLALDNLPYVIREKLLTNTKFAKTFVEYHVLKGIAPSESLQQDQVNATLLQNRTVRFNRYTVDKKSVITVNGAVLDKVDLQASDGVVHALDKALWPQAQYDILDAISATKSLSTFAKAIKDGGMNGTLAGHGPFTIFAPTNEACKKHGVITTEDAKEIVLYHSVGGTQYSAGLHDKEELTTMLKLHLLTRKLEIRLKDGQFSVKGRKDTAKVTVADIPVNNGVLHIIDTVLRPPLLY